MALKTCETCHWWVNPDDRTIPEKHAAECRRHAPGPLPIGEGAATASQGWPITRKTDWCGEWKATKGWRS